MAALARRLSNMQLVANDSVAQLECVFYRGGFRELTTKASETAIERSPLGNAWAPEQSYCGYENLTTSNSIKRFVVDRIETFNFPSPLEEQLAK